MNEMSDELINAEKSPYSSPQTSKMWLRVFTEIWTGKGSALKANLPERRKIAATGLLLYIIAHVFSLYLYSASPGIRADNQALLRAAAANAPSDNSTLKNSSDLLDFTITGAVQSGVFEGFKSLFLISLLFWICFVLIGGGVSFGAAIAGVGGGLIISATGLLVSSLMQFTTGSMRLAPNIGIIVAPSDFPWLYGFLTNIGVFSAWQYVAIGMALAYVARYRPKIGIIIGVFAYSVMLGFAGGMSWLGKLLAR